MKMEQECYLLAVAVVSENWTAGMQRLPRIHRIQNNLIADHHLQKQY